MKKRAGFLILWMIFTWSSWLVAEQDLLKFSDVNTIMNQILEHHVDKKEVTSKILQNALTIYIDQFDLHRIYLLESEVAPFTHLSSERLVTLIEQYKKGDFAIFKQLNQAIQTSIERSRELRENLEVNEAIFQQVLKSQTGEDKQISFAKDTLELKQRILHQLLLFINTQRRRYGETILDLKQSQEKLLYIFEEHIRELENQYLFQDEREHPLSPEEQENLFVIHILKALASSLDAHTSFYQPSEAYDMRVRLQKEFYGVGIALRNTSEGVVVLRLIAGGAAAKSGLIYEGDILLEVDGKSVIDHPFDKVMEMLHEEQNPDVKLIFKRKGEAKQPDKIFTAELKREEIILNNDRVDLGWEAFGNGIIGQITLHAFYQGDGVTSEKDVQNAIQELENKGNLRGLILDLRDNSGGFLSQAVKVAGLFISNGIIVISKYADGDEKIYRDVDSKVVYDGPLVVLTSKTTASAAEIVAQALQDYGVALIVGDVHTFGKGTIQSQTVTDNQSSSYFKVTVGKYYTVSGKTPQKRGVEADIVVPSHWDREPIGEEYLDSPIEPDTISPAFNDTLADISPDVKPWYLKYYIPKLQSPKTVWRNMLPLLRKNSAYRIAHNRNYQLYLTGNRQEKDPEAEEDEWVMMNGKHQNFGEDDLQMEECVNIVKDMIFLHGQEIRSTENK